MLKILKFFLVVVLVLWPGNSPKEPNAPPNPIQGAS